MSPLVITEGEAGDVPAGDHRAEMSPRLSDSPGWARQQSLEKGSVRAGSDLWGLQNLIIHASQQLC